MRQQDKKHTIGVVATLCIILMLIFAGPSSAVKVEVSGLGGTHYVGVPVTFYVNVSLLATDFIPIDNVTITGLRAGTLVFDPSGNQTNDNGRYNVSLLNDTTYYGQGYGYGYDEANGGFGYDFGDYYGYGYGFGYASGTADGARASYRKYKIVMSTSGLPTGSTTDDVKVYVYTGETDTSEFTTSATFRLSKRSGGGGGGSGGTYPPGLRTPTPTVTATATATAAPPGTIVTPRPTITKPTATATETAAEEMVAKKPKKGLLPGFTAVFAIAGMLAIAYAMMRRRE